MEFLLRAALLGVLTYAKECDRMCAAIYSFDADTCSCVPIKGLECLPQYNLNCDQATYDREHGRIPLDKEEQEIGNCENYCDEDWFTLDREQCECMPKEWMECHPYYGEDCDQLARDKLLNRDPFENPYQGEMWYQEQNNRADEVNFGDFANPIFAEKAHTISTTVLSVATVLHFALI